MNESTAVAIVRRGYQAFNEADLETLTRLFDPQATWHTPGRSALGGDRRGRDAVFAQFARYGSGTHGSFRAALQDVLGGEDGRVVGIHHSSARRNGKALNTSCCVVFQVRQGRIVSGSEHYCDLHQWDEFWS